MTKGDSKKGFVVEVNQKIGLPLKYTRVVYCNVVRGTLFLHRYTQVTGAFVEVELAMSNVDHYLCRMPR